MLVRPARPEEYDAVGELTVAAYVEGGHLAADSGYVAQLRDAAARARDAWLLVAEDGGDLVGTVTFCPAGSPWREVATEDEGEFRTLAVAPGAQGRGVGRALVEACIDRSVELGFTALVLCTLPDQTAAHRLYERAGFRRLPTEGIETPLQRLSA